MIDEFLYPYFERNNDTDDINTENEIYKDIAWDFERNLPIIRNGDFVIAEGLEACESWAFRALQAQRYKYEAYTWDYGLDTEQFIGKVLDSKTKIDIIKEITECLKQNTHITDCKDFDIIANKRNVIVNFTMITEYGTSQEEVIY